MHKILTLLLFLACSTLSFSQSITLKGKVLDTDGTPLESATVYLTSVKDSTLIEYTITEKNGGWQLKTRATTEPVFLKISFMGNADYKQQLEGIAEDKDFGTLQMEERSTEMNELVIESEIPPIRIKQDTLEFDAASFKVRPDANVEALLKQLPGVEIDAEGKITVNGKEVNKILVNGKPFFDEDGKIAVQNLPADLINKVQVTDTKTKQEELSGEKATSDSSTINFTIDEDKNKGMFGRVMGGYGTDDRYESSALVNYFNGKTKISLLASSNNINTTGFSMNEIFDSMGGGRNMSVWVGRNGSFGINGQQFGGSDGITTSNIIGLNYADEWVKGFDGSTNYFFTQANTKNSNRSSSVNFVAENPNQPGVDQNYRGESVSSSKSEQFAHNFNTEFNVEIDSTQSLFFAPKFTTATSKVGQDFSGFSQRIADDALLNDREGSTFNENENYSFSSNLVWNKAFNSKKGRYMSFEFNNENRKDDGSEFNNSVTNRYFDQNGDPALIVDARNQVRYNRQATDNYNGKLEFAEPLTDSLKLKVGVEYKLERSLEDRKGFNFDEATGGYTSYNDPLSNYLSSKANTILPRAGLSLRKSKYSINVEGGVQLADFHAGSQYMGDNYNFDKNYALPWAEVGLDVDFTKSKGIWLQYRYNSSFPSPSQVLPVTDISNPLFVTVGNPDLDAVRYHNVYLSFRDFDYATRSGYSIYGGGMYYDNQIQGYTTIDASARTTQEYTNVSGNYYAWFGGSWSKSVKRDAHSYRYNIRLGNDYSVNKAFNNGVQFTSKAFEINPMLAFTYEYGDLLVINPTYEYSYSTTSYTNLDVNTATNFTHKLNLQTTAYWPKHVVFGNDFGYNYNSQLGQGYKKDFYLWNTSLGYNFLKDRLLFKVKVYDILNQNLGTRRTISPQAIVDTENIVLKRYVMFSLTFKLDKFGGKKESSNDFWFW